MHRRKHLHILQAVFSRYLPYSCATKSAAINSLSKPANSKSLCSANSGICPWLMRWALRTMGLTSAWRKHFPALLPAFFAADNIFQHRARPYRRQLVNVADKIRRQPPGTAFSRWCIKVISSMEASSIIIASASSGSLSFLPKLKPLPSGWYSKSRCTVCAGCPLDSARRLAALPVAPPAKCGSQLFPAPL